MIKAYKYRIYPNEVQKNKFEQYFGCCRLVWNLALSAKKQAYDSNEIKVSRFDLQKQLVDLKKDNLWMYEINAQSLQCVLSKLEKTFDNFYSGKGYPKFKKKTGHQTFQYPQRVKVIDGKLSFPKKLGLIKCALSREFNGKIKTVTVSKTPTNKYFASILVDIDKEVIIPSNLNSKTTIGVDVGVKSFVVTSNGKSYEPNRKLKDNLKRLKCLHRRLSRKKKGSNNRKKAKIAVAILYEKITNQRTDYIHKITTQLTHDNQVGSIVIEDLNVVGMLKNRKLSQAISDVSFGEFYRQLTYKCEWYGINLIKIGRYDPSSKRCSSCGKINNSLTLGNRIWECSCGIVHDRDWNAAKNIKWFGLNSRRGTSGEPVELSAIVGAKKQEFLLKIPNCLT